MIQKTYSINDFSNGDFEKMLQTVGGLPEYKNAKQVLLIMLENNWDKDRITAKTAAVKKALPKTETVGINHYNGADLMKQGELDQTVFSFMFFENTAFSVHRFNMDSISEEETGRELNDILKIRPDLRGVMLFISSFGKMITDVLKNASADIKDVPFFGSLAAAYMRFSEHGTPVDFRIHVFDGEGIYSNTLLAVVFSGKDLHIEASCDFGWTPIGREMTITKMRDPYIVEEIDGRPASDIYKRYLGLNDNQINNWANLNDFPLCVERNGMIMGRLPAMTDPLGTLYFTNDLFEGEKLRFTYGVQTRIFTEVHSDSMRHYDFAPQGMLIVVCLNRVMFLKEQADIERGFFEEFSPETAELHGTTEIYIKNGTGGELSSALVAVSFREGDKKDLPRPELSQFVTEDILKQQLSVSLQYRVITFLRAVTDDLHELAQQAVRANRSKSEFLSRMSHEIRTPINAMLGMNEMILRESSQKQIKEYASDIKNAGSTLLAIVNDILDLSKIESGKMEIIPAEYDLSRLLHDLCSMTSVRAGMRSLEFVTDISEDLPSGLYGDDVRISQVLTNLLTNAVKYTERGSVTLRAAGKVSGDTVTLHFEVEDTGIGIKKEDIPKLFEAYSRFEEERNRTVEGTGLGLSITLKLLDMMESSLEVESEYGRGSVFSFDIRQKITDSSPIGHFEQQAKEKACEYRHDRSFTAPEGKILVVDDNLLNLRVFCSLLKETEIQITTAESGKECLELAVTNKFDIIFLDHMMPEMDGIETLHRLRQLNGGSDTEVPVYVLTANAVSGSKEMYLREGFTGYISKPIQTDELEKAITDSLPGKKIIYGSSSSQEVTEEAFPSELPVIEGLDWSYAKLHLPSFKALMLTLKTFMQMCCGQSEKLGGYFAALDANPNEKTLSDYRIQVHGMKSSAATAGITLLSGMANRLEAAARDGEPDVIRSMHKIFTDSWNSYEKKLSVLFPEKKKTADTRPSAREHVSEVSAWIRVLTNAMEYMDIDEADRAVGSILRYSFPDRSAELAAKLNNAVMTLDTEMVNDISEQLLKALK